MTSASLTVLDVGHGNCTLVRSCENTVMIDAGMGSFVQDTIKGLSLTEIDAVIVSHADADHIGGLVGLLLDESIHIKNVYINQDIAKKTKTYKDLIIALSEARQQERGTKVTTAINKDTLDLDFGEFQIEVLGPSPINSILGTGSEDLGGGAIESNGMSVVLRVKHGDQKIALIPGDMNLASLSFIKEEGDSIRSKVLVFPHHGGSPGDSNPIEFAKEVCDMVEPELVIFSNSRIRHNNPRSDIIDGIVKAVCSPRLACTQLSRECHAEEEGLSSEHLVSSYPSRGQALNHSCAGTINIEMVGGCTDILSPLKSHSEYIKKFSKRKCRHLSTSNKTGIG